MIAPISERAGGAGRLSTPHPSASQILSNSDFSGSKRNFGNANFYKSFHVSFCLFFSFKETFISLNLSRRGKAR